MIIGECDTVVQNKWGTVWKSASNWICAVPIAYFDVVAFPISSFADAKRIVPSSFADILHWKWIVKRLKTAKLCIFAIWRQKSINFSYPNRKIRSELLVNFKFKSNLLNNWRAYVELILISAFLFHKLTVAEPYRSMTTVPITSSVIDNPPINGI